MDVAVHLWIVVPVRMLIFFEDGALSYHILQMVFPAMAALVSGQAVEHRLVRGLLQIHVERGVNPQPALVDLVAAVLAFQVAADLFHKIRSQRIRIMLQDLESSGCSCASVACWRRDLSVFQHGVDHQIAALQSAVGMQ